MQSGQIAAAAFGARDAGLPVRMPVTVHHARPRGSVVARCASTSRSHPRRRSAPGRHRRRRPPRDLDDRAGARRRATSACTAAPRSRRRARCASELGEGLLGGERERRADRRLRRRRLAARVPRRAARADGHLLDDERDARDPRGRPRAARRCCSGASSTSTPSPRRPASAGEDVALLCAGFQGAFALDDAYCAGRIVQLLGGERDRLGEGRGRDRPRLARRARRSHWRGRTARPGSRRTSRSAPR